MTSPTHPNFISHQVRDGRYLFLNLSPDDHIPLNVVCAGRESCAANYRIERGAFPYYAIEYVASGQGRFIAKDRNFEIKAGSILTYGPEIPHIIESTGANLTKYFLDLSGTEIPSRLEECNLPPGSHRFLENRRWVHDLFDQLLHCVDLPRELAERLAPSLSESLLLNLCHSGEERGSTTSRARQKFRQCRDYILNHARELDKVEEAARQCGVTLPYLVRLFKTFSQESPYQYLTRLKMSMAADLLINRNMEIKEIAATVGFQDPYHFSRAFKKFHHQSPLHFRNAFHRG